MTGRERVQNALEHKPSAVPIDCGSSAVTGMHVSVVAALREAYRLDAHPVKVIEPYQMLGELEEDLKAALGIDVEGIYPRNTMFGFPNTGWKEWRTPWGQVVLVPESFHVSADVNGDVLIHPEGDAEAAPSGRMPKNGFFFDTIIRQDPIDEDDLHVEDNLEEFEPVTEDELAYFRQEASRLLDSERAVLANFGGTGLGDIALVPGPMLKHPRGIRDITEWYISILTRQDYICEIFDRQTELAIQNLARIHEEVGEVPDIIFLCGTDFGTQNSTFCSADTFRRLYLPFYRRLTDWIHEHTGWKVFKHCCGAIADFMPLFVEAGFDIINPVQISAAGMDPHRLKSEYGRQIVFWGGGVDTQRTMPFRSSAEVRAEVLENCAAFAPGGGFVFNSVHNVQAKSPTENVVAMFEAVHEFNRLRRHAGSRFCPQVFM